MLFRRTAKMAAIVVTAVMALALAPLASTPAGAAGSPRAAENFTLDLVEGELLLRGGEEPYQLENPTSFAGTVDTGEGGSGAITAAAFTTPTVSFEQEITEPLEATVYIDATFSEVTPGTSTGSIDADGNLLLQTSLNVDLHIEVGNPAFITADCTSTPVNLTLESTSAYDPETDQVTVADADFTVPPVITEPACNPLVQGPINEQLAGSGHSITFTLEGDIELPPAPGCPTDTSVVVDPADEARLGNPVTMTATVVQEPGSEENPDCADAPAVPTGFVDFSDGDTVLGTVPLEPDGTAELTTSSLAAGTHALTVRYRGTAPYSGSTSEVTEYLVAATPAVTAGVPEHLTIGAAPVEFGVSLTNTGLGSAVENGRVDVTLRRPAGNSSPFNTSMIDLEYFDGAAWQPVTLTTPNTTSAYGSIGAATGTPLGVGEEIDLQLRIAIGFGGDPQPQPGPITVDFELVPVDPVDGTPAVVPSPSPDALSRATGTMTMVPATRIATTIAFQAIVLGQPVQPNIARQGNVVVVRNFRVNPDLSGVRPSGKIEVFLGGRRLDVRQSDAPLEDGYTSQGQVAALNSLHFVIPPETNPGTHQVIVKYLGDGIFAPSENTTSLTVVGSVGTLYECSVPFVPPYAFNANVVASANLPSARPAGAVAPLANLDVQMFFDRSQATFNALNGALGAGTTTVGSGNLQAISFGIGPAGSGTAASSTRTGTVQRLASDTVVDHTVTFDGETASVNIEGAPGEVLPVELDSIVLTATSGGLPFPITCVPADQPIEFGKVTVAGTTLAVDAPTPTREGDAVTLTASVAPSDASGTVEFLDGSETIGVVPVSGGTASMATSALDAGSHSLTARFYGGLMAISTTSDPASLTVLPEFDCPTQTEEGNGAIVRLVYLELLNRCASQTDYEFWKGQLDGGLSRVTFSNRIAYSFEALGIQVDEAYQTMLGRPSDPAGRAHWVPFLKANGYFRLLAELGASSEYWEQAGGTVGGFVDRTYLRLLDRPSDPAGRQHWIDRLEGGESRRVMLVTFARTTESARRLVTAAFQQILDRDPNSTELADEVPKLVATGDRAALYGRLIGTDEFDDRAQTFPNQGD